MIWKAFMLWDKRSLIEILENTSGNLSYFYCGGIAAGLQQNFITFSLHFGGYRIAVGLQKNRLHFNYIFITFILHLYYIIAIEM